MRSSGARVAGLISALAVAGVLGACGSSTDSGETAETVSPLAELMGWQQESPEEGRRKQLAVEDLVAACMREQGWEYTPVDYAAQSASAADDVPVDPEEFGRRFGYGVVRSYEQYELPGLRGEDVGPTETVFVDPNQDYVAGLSESEREEYYESLNGQAPVATVVGADEEVTDTVAGTVLAMLDQGCQGRAHAEVYGEDPMATSPDLQQRLSEHWTNVQNDPRMSAAIDEWTECMGPTLDGVEVAGSPIRRPEHMYQYVDELKQRAAGLEVMSLEEAEAIGGAYSSWEDGEGRSGAYVGEPKPIPPDELEELRRTEMELWQLDWDCRVDARITEIQREIEQEFVDELRAEFPELGERGS